MAVYQFAAVTEHMYVKRRHSNVVYDDMTRSCNLTSRIVNTESEITKKLRNYNVEIISFLQNFMLTNRRCVSCKQMNIKGDSQLLTMLA